MKNASDRPRVILLAEYAGVPLPELVLLDLDLPRKDGREVQCKRERAAQEVVDKRKEAEAAKRRAEFEAERVAQAKKQAAEDKARERERYIAAGGDPDDFEQDFVAIRQALIAQRVILYLRVSTEEQKKKGYSVRDQIESLEEWVAVPLADSGIDSKLIDLARDNLSRGSNRLPKSRGKDGRLAELGGGIIRCAHCGRALSPSSINRKTGGYYRCTKRAIEGRDACPNSHHFRARDIDALVWEFVSDILSDPTALREGIEGMLDTERKAARDTGEAGLAALLKRRTDLAASRERVQRLVVRGVMDEDEGVKMIKELEEEGRTLDRRINYLQGDEERLAQLEVARDELLASFETGAPKKLRDASPEKRAHVYRAMRLTVEAHSSGEIVARWAFGEPCLLVSY